MPAAVSWVGFLPLFVFFQTISQKNDSARITKLEIQMFQDECWKLIYFGVKGQGCNVRFVFRQYNIATTAAYISYTGFFLLLYPPYKKYSDTRFSLREFSTFACCCMLGFPRHGCLHFCECRHLLHLNAVCCFARRHTYLQHSLFAIEDGFSCYQVIIWLCFCMSSETHWLQYLESHTVDSLINNIE